MGWLGAFSHLFSPVGKAGGFPSPARSASCMEGRETTLGELHGTTTHTQPCCYRAFLCGFKSVVNYALHVSDPSSDLA